MLFGETRDDRIQELFEKHIQNTAACAAELHSLFLEMPRGHDFIASVATKVVEMEGRGRLQGAHSSHRRQDFHHETSQRRHRQAHS